LFEDAGLTILSDIVVIDAANGAAILWSDDAPGFGSLATIALAGTNCAATPLACMFEASEVTIFQPDLSTGDRFIVHSDVPEPCTLLLLAAGTLGLGFGRRKVA
jgi:hypothetical protein